MIKEIKDEGLCKKRLRGKRKHSTAAGQKEKKQENWARGSGESH